MLSSELIAQIRRLELRAGHLVTDTLMGEYASVFRGQGMEFDEVREYVPGDDVRTIDWNVTARSNAPHVKVHKEEREQTLMLMVDVSPSQNFGSKKRFKNEVAAEFAAVLAFLATRNNDKVGVILFSDMVEKYIPPKKGRAHIWRIIREILTFQSKGKSTDIALALDFAQRVNKRRSLCFLISDFYAKDYSNSLLLASRRHNMVCAHISDPTENALPKLGFVEFQDAETGEHIVVDTSSRAFQKNYHALVEQDTAQLRKFLKTNGIDYLRLSSDGNVVKPLEEFLRFKERRGR